MPVPVRDLSRPTPGPYTNIADDTGITVEHGSVGQDDHPDPDGTASKRLVIEDFDGASTPVPAGATRARNRINAIEWVTLTLADGASDAVAAAAAERLSMRIKWSTETDISRNNVVDGTQRHFDYNGGRNTGSSSNEVYIGRWVNLPLDAQAPSLTSVDRNHGIAGHPLAGEKILGADFDPGARVVITSATTGKMIQVSNVVASTESITFDTSLMVLDGAAQRPADAGVYRIKVQNPDDQTSNEIDFTVE